jgi:signal peptidase I
METPSPKPRRPWLAGLLSLLGGPLGQIYIGRLRRSLFLWLAGVCYVLAFLVSLVSLPIGFYGFLLLCLGNVAFQVCVAADAFVLARWNRHAALKKYQRWWIYALFFAFFYASNNALAFFVRAYITEAFIMPTRAMSPTIQPRDRIAVDKLWYNPAAIHRGDVVVFRSQGPGSPPFIQRVAGMPGDVIEIKNERVFINGKARDDPYAVFDKSLPTYDPLSNYRRTRLPPGYCFLLGDNRRRSKDSRMIGPVPLSDVYGKACLIYWSRQRTFPDPNDTTRFLQGPIQWERLGLRLD